jgi:hypothetical protein
LSVVAACVAIVVTVLTGPSTSDAVQAGSPGALGGIAAPPQGTGSPAGNGGVLVVGDSLEVLTSPYLRRYLPGVPLKVNAQGGYNSYQIFDLFQESYDPSQSVIVFDAGTNDNPAYPQILEGNLNKVAATIGNRCMVVPTIHGFTVNGVNNDGKNRVVEQFAASRPGTQVPDWAGFVAAHPDLMQSDDLHPIPEGADKRAQLIAAGVQACLAGTLSSAPSTHAAAPPVAAPKPPAPVSGGHLAATEVMRRVSAVLNTQVRLLQRAFGT